MTRFLAPLILGLGGCAVLISLGVWQLNRAEWKADLLARIDAAIAAEPVPLAEARGDEYEAVIVTGRFEGPVLRFIHSGREELIVTGLRTEEGSLVLVDLGLAAPRAPIELPETPVTVTGNLSRPKGSGAELIAEGVNVPGARDLDALVLLFGSEPTLVVASRTDPAVPGVTPLPLDTGEIPNNHFGYAIQWFGLAIVWAGMALFWAVRIARGTREGT